MLRVEPQIKHIAFVYIRKSSISNFLVWVIITLFYCYQYILRILPNLVQEELIKDYNITLVDFGNFAGIYYLGYIAAHIPIGLALARWGGKKVLPICIILTSLGLVPLLNDISWSYVLVGRLIIGVGSSAAIVGVLQTFRILFAENFTRITGYTVFCSLLTTFYASTPLLEMINSVGIFLAIKILIIGGLVLSITTYVLLPKNEESFAETRILNDIVKILTNKNVIIVSLFSGMMIGPLEGFSDAWGTGFFNSVYSIKREIANNIVASIYSGMCVGCIVLPYIASKTNKHYNVTIFSGFAMMICFICLLNKISSSQAILDLFCIIIGIFCAYQVVIVSKISTFVEERLSGSVAAVANMIIMIFGSFFHGSIGFIMERSAIIDNVNGAKMYPSEAYINSVSIIPFAIVIAIIGLTIIMHKDKKFALK